MTSHVVTAKYALETASRIMDLIPEEVPLTALTIYPQDDQIITSVVVQMPVSKDAQVLAESLGLRKNSERSKTPGHYVWEGRWGGARTPVTVIAYVSAEDEKD